VDIARAEQRAPAYLALNPMGKVPVLAEDAFVLPESAAIMIYLAENHGGDGLYPQDQRRRAEVNRWLFWAAAHWAPAASALVFEQVFKPRLFKLGEPDEVQVNRQRDLLRGLGKVLDDQLAANQWVAGDAMTLADIAIAPSLAGLAPLPVE